MTLVKKAAAGTDDGRVADRICKTQPRIDINLVLQMRLSLVTHSYEKGQPVRYANVILRKDTDLDLMRVQQWIAARNLVLERQALLVAFQIRKRKFTDKSVLRHGAIPAVPAFEPATG